VSRRTGVRGRVLVRRVVAAQCGSALLTRPQVHPVGSDLFTLIANPSLWVLDGVDGLNVRTQAVGSGWHIEKGAASPAGREFSIPCRRCRRSSTGRARPAAPRRSPDGRCRLRASSRGGLANCHSTTWCRTPGTF